tara:strand:+ start:17460 stop:18368 length:909 start_codon:yes stop_codon:yes gene_type:complete
MKVLFDNVNFSSRSGPNSFASKLSDSLALKGHDIFTVSNMTEKPDVQLSFIASSFKISPMVQRLDGIYFNSKQDYMSLNHPIKETFYAADAVIYQSIFNKNLTEKWFGEHENSFVINNGTALDDINSIEPMSHSTLDKFDNVWCCASSWRPHKRLSENIRYFLEFSSKNDCLVIAGNNPDVKVNYSNIFYAGDLEWSSLISLYKRSNTFIHLSWLDHCPNVVIDARACGLKVICSSSGGTPEIAGKNSLIVHEEDWDMSPIELYNPPSMDFSKTAETIYPHIDIDISSVACKYIDVFKSILE